MSNTPAEGAKPPQDPYDFSLVLGGPLYQLWRRLHSSGPALELLARRMIGIPPAGLAASPRADGL